jgi:hypothetical protein
LKPIIDKAEVAIDFPDKTYFGTFGRNSVFDVACDGERVRLRLSHPGTDQRTAEIHVHYYLLADILGPLNSNGGWGGGLPAHNGGQGKGSGGGEIDDPGLPAHNADNVKPPPTAQFIPGNPENPIAGNRIPPKIHGPNPGPIPLKDPRTQ